MLIYNILAEGSLAGAGKSVTLPVSVKSSDKEEEKVSYLQALLFFTDQPMKDNLEELQKGIIGKNKRDKTDRCAAQSKYNKLHI